MTWPVAPMPTQARALLLLPSGHRAFDDDVTLAVPTPFQLDVDGHTYLRFHSHAPGQVDAEARVLYVLGGVYQPRGYGPARPGPDEAYDQ